MRTPFETAPDMEARLRADSARRVAEGQGPEPKMAGLGIMARAPRARSAASRWAPYKDRQVWWFYRAGAEVRLVKSDLQGRQVGDDTPLSSVPNAASQLRDAIYAGSAVVATNTAVLAKVADELAGGEPLVDNSLCYARMSPLVCNVGTVEGILARRFWPATYADTTLRSWLDAFGVDHNPVGMLSLAPHLFGGSLTDHQVLLANSAIGIEWQLLGSTPGLRTFSNSIAAFTLAEASHSLWTAMLCHDPLYRPYATAQGLAPLVTPLRLLDTGEVVAVVSTPCRLRVGDTVDIGQGPTRIGAATLSELSFDDDHGLVGVFTTSTRRNTGSSQGFAMLARSLGSTFWASTTPFRPWALMSTNRSWDPRRTREVLARDVPLDVVLAGS